VVAVHLLLLAESPCWPVEAGCWWVGNMTCHLQQGGEHLTSGLSLRLSLPLCFSNPLHGLPRSLHRQWGGEARPRKWTDVVESNCPSNHFDYYKSFLCDHVTPRSHDPSLMTAPIPASHKTLLYDTPAYSPFPLHDSLSLLVIFSIHSLTHHSHSMTHSSP